MRHNSKTHSFGRRHGPRKALLRGLVTSLVANGRIRTTLAKAKEVRRLVERAITIGKDGSMHSRRILLARYPNENTVTTIMNDLAPRFKKRPGGYTRILKVGARPGDAADMALIEFVDYKLPEAKGEETVKGDKNAKARARTQLREVEAKRRTLRKHQGASRRVFRANVK